MKEEVSSASRTAPRLNAAGGFWRSVELEFVIALVLALSSAAILVLGILRERTELLYDDLRLWTVEVVGRRPENDFRPGSGIPEPERPFHLVLQLDRVPQVGDRVAAERTFVVERGALYCFKVFATSDYYRPESEGAVKTFQVAVLVNDREEAVFPIADRKKAEPIVVGDIRPIDGRIVIRFEVRGLVSRRAESWRRASTVDFELARLFPCSAGAVDRGGGE